MYLYVTCDRIGSDTGGGIVTKHELDALRSLGDTDVYNPPCTQNPFEAESSQAEINLDKYKLAHFYAGTFPNLTKRLKEKGIKISYTAAAHSIEDSITEFRSMGVPYDYPHITDPNLWSQYLKSYLTADLVITPSSYSEQIMKSYGCNHTLTIPHGSDPKTFYPYPKVFSVGYLGQIGPDKGIRYLIEAWSKLNYKDAILTLAGAQSPLLINMIRTIGGSANYNILGFVKTLDELFKSINVYVQPSVTEGFGIEVLESMAFGRPVITTTGAGASDCINDKCRLVKIRDVDGIAKAIDWYKNNRWDYGVELINHANRYNWTHVRELYKKAWLGLLKT